MMTQPNLDYLLQITSPLVERPPSGSGPDGVDRPGFGDHLAQASGSTRSSGSHSDLRERPSPSGPLEPKSSAAESSTIDDESSDADLSSDEYGACAEPAQPAACGGDESGSSESETDVSDASPAEASSDTSSVEEFATQNESESEADSDEAEIAADVVATGADITGPTDAATNTLHITLTDVVTDAVQSETGEGAENSNGQRSESPRPQGERPAPGKSSPGAASDFTGDLRQLDLEGKSSQPVQASTIALTAETQNASIDTGEVNAAQPAAKDADKATRKSVATSHDSGHVNHAARDHAVSHNVEGVQSKSSEVRNNSRRTSDKIKSTDDSRRRSNENREPRGAQRADPSGGINHTAANALVSDVRVDVVASSTKSSGDESAPKAGNAPGPKSDVVLHPLARANRGHVAGRAGSADSANSLPRVDTTRFVGRVAKAIQTANERGGALQLRLSPPELGSLRLQLTVHDGAMSASLEAESSAARQLLLDHLPSLRDRLAEQNIRIDRFDVDVRQEGSGGQPDPRNSQHEQRQQQLQHSTTRREATRAPNGDGTAPDTTALHSRMTNNGLNVLA
jgi:flagellar hook-length control protein FliK